MLFTLIKCMFIYSSLFHNPEIGTAIRSVALAVNAPRVFTIDYIDVDDILNILLDSINK